MPRRSVGKQAYQHVTRLCSSLSPSSLIMLLVCAYLVLALLWSAVWQWTGSDRWIEEFFKVPVALLFVALATIEISASLMVRREFSPGQPMRKAWSLISLSAALSLAGALCVQVLAAQSVLNPLVRMAWWDPSWAASIRQFGLFLGGTCRFATLAVGLAAALKAYRRSGLLARLTIIDRALLSFTGVYMLLEIHDVAMFLRAGWRPKPAMIMGWPTDPLLWLLLAEALILYRSARQMNGGWIARCWKAFSIGIFVMVLGDVSVWAISRNYLPWPWSALEWYIWLPGASAFALAPVYQLEAIHHARFREG